MAGDASLGGVRVGKLTNITPPKPLSTPTDKFTLYFNDNSMEALWLAVTWGGG